MPAQVDFRARFPSLERITYLATCSHGARSVDLDQAMARMLDAMPAGPWASFEQELDRARREFAELVKADPDQVAVLPDASTAAYQVATSRSWKWRPGLVCSGLEFPSLQQVWLGQRSYGADVRIIDDPLPALDERTGLVSMPLVSYQDGVRPPVGEVVARAHDAGAKAFVDGYQALGVEPVDVVALDCDYLVAGMSKYLLGLPGIAFLYLKDPLDADRPPGLTGWFGQRDPFGFDPRSPRPADSARRLEVGTPAVPSLFGATAGLGLVAGLDLAAVRAHVAELTQLALDTLVGAGEAVSSPRHPDERGAHLSLRETRASALTAWLAERDVVVSPRGDAVRLSFHFYNNEDDVAAVCSQIRRFRCET